MRYRIIAFGFMGFLLLWLIQCRPWNNAFFNEDGTSTTKGATAVGSVKRGTKSITDNSLDSLSGVSVDNTTLVFQSPPRDVANLSSGDFVVLGVSPQTPNGMLRKISSVDEQNGNITLTTTEAQLEDVFDDLTIAIRSDFAPDDPDVTLKSAYQRCTNGSIYRRLF